MGVIVIPISSGVACGLLKRNKVKQEILMQKHKKYIKLYEKDQQPIESFDKLYRKSLRDNLIDKNEYDPLCKILTKYVNKTKNESFLKT